MGHSDPKAIQDVHKPALIQAAGNGRESTARLLLDWAVPEEPEEALLKAAAAGQNDHVPPKASESDWGARGGSPT